MKGNLALTLTLLTLAVRVCLGIEPGFTPLLDADHLDGWKQCGPGGMEFAGGEATMQMPKEASAILGCAWYTKKSFGDFTLRLEFKVNSPTANSGVNLRFPDPGDTPRIVTDKGYEVQIYGSIATSHPTGEIYGFQAPTSVPMKTDDWNDLEVSVAGQRYTVTLNGTVVNEFTGTRQLSGYIGLQNHRFGTTTFRNVRIMEAGDPPPHSPVASVAPSSAAVGGAPAPRYTAIQELAEHSAAVADQILAPLENTAAASLHAYTLTLRENLRDESTRGPAGSASTYVSATHLCDLLIAACNERVTILGRLPPAPVAAPVSRATLATTIARKGKPKWADLERERLETRILRDTRLDTVLGKQLKTQWAVRTVTLHDQLDKAFAQFRAAARQPFATP